MTATERWCVYRVVSTRGTERDGIIEPGMLVEHMLVYGEIETEEKARKLADWWNAQIEEQPAGQVAGYRAMPQVQFRAWPRKEREG